MRATSVGHAGILIDTVDGSILCDPWFVPAFFGSWFVFPRNDHLSDELRAHVPVDHHWLQYSGAIWYPMVYDESPERMRELVDAKIASQFARAMRYVEAVGARAVVPSAGPPAFVDPEVFHLNVIDGD